VDLPIAAQGQRHRALGAHGQRLSRRRYPRQLDPELVTPHVMRHTPITNLVQAGVDLPTIQKISGHKTLAMVVRYAHGRGQHIDKAIVAIGRTVPELPMNGTGSKITPELHTPSRREPVVKFAKSQKWVIS
jgi:integrase